MIILTKNILFKILISLKDIISPSQCAYCKIFLSTKITLCNSCTNLISPIISEFIKLSPEYTMIVHAAGDYENPLKYLILSKLWSNRLASKQIAHIIWQNSQLKNINFDYLVPIPLHWTRYAWRGYNQSEIICKELSKLSGKPYINIIKRTKKTFLQSMFKPSMRVENIKGAFTIHSDNLQNNPYANKVLVLVDDLMTTGITLREAGKILIPLNPKAILAVVGSRVLN